MIVKFKRCVLTAEIIKIEQPEQFHLFSELDFSYGFQTFPLRFDLNLIDKNNKGQWSFRDQIEEARKNTYLLVLFDWVDGAI